MLNYNKYKNFKSLSIRNGKIAFRIQIKGRINTLLNFFLFFFSFLTKKGQNVKTFTQFRKKVTNSY